VPRRLRPVVKQRLLNGIRPPNDLPVSGEGRYVMVDSSTAGAARRPSFIHDPRGPGSLNLDRELTGPCQLQRLVGRRDGTRIVPIEWLASENAPEGIGIPTSGPVGHGTELTPNAPHPRYACGSHSNRPRAVLEHKSEIRTDSHHLDLR
jgi:hypothetical protein